MSTIKNPIPEAAAARAHCAAIAANAAVLKDVITGDRTAATAARFGISEQCAALQRDLLTLPGAVKVEFDLDGFYDHLEEVILVVKFDIPVVNENYYCDLRALRQGVINTAARHGLTRTPDTIQNYGEHLYFVFHHDSTWEHPVTEQPD